MRNLLMAEIIIELGSTSGEELKVRVFVWKSIHS